MDCLLRFFPVTVQNSLGFLVQYLKYKIYDGWEIKWDVSKVEKGTNLYRFYGHKAFDDQTVG